MTLLTCLDCGAQFARTGFDGLERVGQVIVDGRAVPARKCTECGGPVPFQ